MATKEVTVKSSLLKVFMVVALGTLILVPGMANAYIEQFNSNSANWGNGFTEDVNIPSTYNASGGNPGGYISGDVGNTAPFFWYMFIYDSPYATFGNLTGQYMTTDFKISGSVQTENPTVRFYIGAFVNNEYEYFVSKQAYSFNPNLDTVWTTHKVATNDPAKWEPWVGSNTGAVTLAAVLSIYDDIGLAFYSGDDGNLGFSSTKGATIRVDNFGSSPVPLPGTALLMGSGLLGLGLQRLRKRTQT
jgi:hypothetical protein